MIIWLILFTFYKKISNINILSEPTFVELRLKSLTIICLGIDEYISAKIILLTAIHYHVFYDQISKLLVIN